MEIPKKYQKVIDDLIKVYDFLYLDSLVLIMRWRRDNEVEYPEWGYIGGGKASLFYKYVYELIDHFYQRYYQKEGYQIGEDFAIWLLKTPLDYLLPIPHHAEMGRELVLDNNVSA
jgi:hypothetical protein